MLRTIVSISAISLILLDCPAGRGPSLCVAEDTQKDREQYIPKDLDDCFLQLKKILKPEELEKMKRGTEEDMGRYHFGLGMWMRNNWGLWKGGRLATWFNAKGIHHPDDMSGIILDSYWRHLNSKPIELDKQIKYYQDYWKKVRIDEQREKVRVERAAQRIRGMMMGISLAKGDVPTAIIPNRKGKGLQAWYLARLGNGVLIAARQGPREDLAIQSYYLDLEKRTIHPITIPEIKELRDEVVAGSTAYFSGVTNGKPVLVAVNGKSRTLIALPEKKDVPLLGMDGGNLLAAYRHSIYTRQGGTWSVVYRSDIDLPKSGCPQKVGDKVFFCDSGFSWLELTVPHRLVSFDEDVGVVGSEGPRWETTASYQLTPRGDLWAVVGSSVSGESLIKRSASGKYEIAVMNNRLQFDGELLGSDIDQEKLPLSAVSMNTKDVLLLAGSRGIYTLEDKCLKQVVAFDNVRNGAIVPNGPWHGSPSDVLQLDGDRYILAGGYNGVYLIERTASSKYIAVSLDEAIGTPVTF
jgi:hypothetical protein